MITILTTTGAYRFESATDWARGGNDDIHVYDDGPDGPDTSLATFAARRFVGVLHTAPSEAQRVIAEAHSKRVVSMIEASADPRTHGVEHGHEREHGHEYE
jgi:hypothetical protein